MYLNILEGRKQRAVIVNETLVQRLNWKDPIRKRYQFGTVIGVIKDFNYFSLRREIQPMFITHTRERPQILNIKLRGDQVLTTLDYMRAKWKQVMPGSPVDISFLNQQLEQLYTNDIRQMKLIRLLSIVCILLCCLGLLGLTSYSTEVRTKEIAFLTALPQLESSRQKTSRYLEIRIILIT